MKTKSASGKFNVATIAWCERNGVRRGCYGCTFTWHDDPRVTQEITGPETARFDVVAYSTERETVEDFNAPLMPPDEFSRFCRLAGCQYRRDVEW